MAVLTASQAAEGSQHAALLQMSATMSHAFAHAHL
jgi:hypothetical protein